MSKQQAPSHPMPDQEGHYWAKWRIASDGTRDGDELTPSNKWEIVQVNDNNGKEMMRFTVSVPGVEAAQWLDCFVWGPRVPEYRG
ncbi:MAG: hypothetical protein ABF893_16535 [Gluconacetobacter liquefaciens]